MCVCACTSVLCCDTEVAAPQGHFAGPGTGASGILDAHTLNQKHQRFNVQSIPKSEMRFPRAHTCFNRLDLPCYESSEEMATCLEAAISADMNAMEISLE